MSTALSRYAMQVLVLFVFVSAPAAADSTFTQLANKYTYITARGAGVISQPLDGFWWWTDKPSGRTSAKPDTDLYRHTVMGGRKWLLVHRGGTPKIDESIRPNQRHLIGEGVPGVVGQFKYDGTCLNGLIRTSEVREPNRPPECPQYYWWSLTRMCVSKDHRSGEVHTSGYKDDAKTCQLDRNQPVPIAASLERFLGAAFAPIIGNKYFHTVTVAAPAQFVAELKFAWDYRQLKEKGGEEVTKVRVYLGPSTSGTKYEVLHAAPISGEHVFAAHQGGRYHFIFDVYDRNNSVIHSDYLVADLR